MTQSSRPVIVQAHAKINLHLQIGDRRADGYHDVVTVLQSLALHDTLTCEARPGPFELRCDRADVPLDASNLVWRAARLVAGHAGLGEPANAVITIEKRIPMQAGLGGGSADAAAALIGCAQLWDLAIGRGDLAALASRLGADVPFCLIGGTALGRGRGDELSPLPALPPYHALIVMPPFGVSTPDAYRWHDERVARLASASAARQDHTAAAPVERVIVPAHASAGASGVGAAAGEPRWPASPAGWPDLLPSLSNDFETVVGPRFPDLPATVAALRDAGARFAAMSGSGAAIVGLFDSRSAADAASAPFAARAGWRTFLTATRPATTDPTAAG